VGKGGDGGGGGEGGEMTQTLYAHMNKRKKRGKQKKMLFHSTFNFMKRILFNVKVLRFIYLFKCHYVSVFSTI
jgi:hypothetical protein